MAKDLILDVVARKNSRDLSTLADEFDKLAKKTDDAGRKMHQTGTFSQFLEGELAKTKVKVKELGEEFERTGNKDVFAKLRGAQANVRSLEGIQKQLTSALESGVKAAIPVVGDSLTQAGQAGSKNLWQAFSQMPPQAQAAIAAGVSTAVGVAAPVLGSMVGGAILAGIGAAGIGAGIAVQLHDPAVESALADLKSRISKDLTDATSAFAPVAIRGFEELSKAADDIAPGLRLTFTKMAPYAERLFKGFADMARNAAPGFEKAMEVGSQILARIADSDLPRLGLAMKQTLDMMSEHPKQAADGVHYAFVAVEATFMTFGFVIKTLMGNLRDLQVLAAAARGDWPGLINLLGSDKPTTLGKAIGAVKVEAAGAGDEMQKLAARIDQVNLTTDTLAGKMSQKMFSAFMSVDQASLHWHETLTSMHETLAKNGTAIDKHTHALDLNSKKGQENESAILGAVQANMAQYQAWIAAGSKAEDAARQYDTNTLALEKQMRQAGYTQAQIDTLIGKYKGIPDTVNTAIATQGLTEAINSLDDAIRLANHLDGRVVKMTIQEEHRTIFTGSMAAVASDYHGHASGGRVAIPGYAQGGGVIKVGEMGPEYLSLPAMNGPAYVTPNHAINGAANRGSGEVIGELRVVHVTPTGDVIRTELVNLGRQRGYRTVDDLLPVGTAR
jgi:hypothetical protein